MPSSAAGDVVVRQTGYAVSPIPGEGRRSAESAAPMVADVAAGLESAGFEVAAALGVTPSATQRRSEASPGAIELDVPIGPGEASLVLIEDADGVLAWQLPENAGLFADRRRSDTAVDRFVISPSAEIEAPARRGFLTDVLLEKVLQPARIYVLRFLARKTIEAAIAHVEGAMACGPVLVIGSNPAAWGVTDLAFIKAQLPTAGPKRVLLLVHGTFSSTAGSFAGLAGQAALDGYDLVLGHDHRTLQETPEANAEAILATLRALALPADCEIDAIAYSRGGLVYRALVERLVPQSPLQARFRKAVFIACTNGGTLLAEPDNWKALLDVYTNVLVGGARLGLGLAGAGAATPFVTAALRTMGGFAQMLSQVAISERYAPGLAAMEPDGDLVRTLNAAPVPVGGLPQYFAITSNYEPAKGDASFAQRAVLTVLDRVADRLYGDVANDLVVPTASMTEFGPARRAEAVAEVPGERAVYHTIYFYNETVQHPIGQWLAADTPDVLSQRLDESAGRRTFDAPSSRGFDPEPPPRRGPAGMDWAADLAGVPPALADGVEGAAGFAGGGAEPATSAFAAAPLSAETTERYLGAEMAPFPQLGTPANVYVTVSPDPIVVANHAAAAASDAPVTLQIVQPVTIVVIAQVNCEVVGPREQTVELTTRDEVLRKFKVRGLAAGAAEIVIEARQGNATVASFRLHPVFVEGKPAPLRAQAALTAPPQPKSGGRAVLRIYEFASPGGLVLQFNLTIDAPPTAEFQTQLVDPRLDLKAYAQDVLKGVEDAWNLEAVGSDPDAIYDSVLARLIDDAKQRTESLVPEPIRRALWKHRDKLRAIQVISSEPYIPWEMMYLSDPDGPEDDGFFAEKGLVRWLHDAPPSRPRVALGTGKRHFVIPDYPAGKQLKGAAAEKLMLVERFPDIAPVDARSLAVRDFLKGQARGCALLHFACHGRTLQGNVIDSDLMMTDQANAAGRIVADPLTWQTVSTNADFGPDGGPLVFINACQTGQPGAGIAGVGGFASAFLRPRSRNGAAAFIGALWSVDDKLANDFARTVYDRLEAGAALGEAVTAARQVCKTKRDFTWLAYSVYTAE